MTNELERLIAWLEARPNNAAIFATDTGFMAQTLEEKGATNEAEGKTIAEAIANYEKEFGKKNEKE